jgi:SAM-dependent methyltransferase
VPEADPIDLLFADMHKLGPGADADTLYVLGLLSARQLRIVVDAGCGTGRQTIALARALGTEIQAVDSHAPFLGQLAIRARAAGDGTEQVRSYFQAAYPDMQHTHRNIEIAQGAGYSVIATHTLPSSAWIEDYYDILYPRAKALVGHPDPAVGRLAAATIKEVDTFTTAQGSFGYVFYVLRRGDCASR